MPADAMLRMSVGLVLVVLAILACAWVAKRAGMGFKPTRRLMNEIDAMRLGPRQRITLVEVDQTWLVVGISAGQMTLLHSQPANAAAAIPSTSAGERLTPTKPGFAALLARARSGRPSA